MSNFLKQCTRSFLIVGLVSVFGLGIAATSFASSKDDGAKSDYAAQKAQDKAAKDAEKDAKEAEKAQEKAAKDAEKADKDADKGDKADKPAKGDEHGDCKNDNAGKHNGYDCAGGDKGDKPDKDAEKCAKYAAKGKVKKGCEAGSPGQTAGAPLAASTPAAAPQLMVLGQALRPCTSRRVMKIRIARRKGVRYSSATVTMNGKRIATRKGKRITAPINLTGLSKGTYKIVIRVRTTKGKVLKGTRTYHTCVAKIPTKRAPKL